MGADLTRRLRRLQRFGRIPAVRDKLRRGVCRLLLRRLDPYGAGTASSRRIRVRLDALSRPTYRGLQPSYVPRTRCSLWEDPQGHSSAPGRRSRPAPLVDPTELPNGFELYIGASDELFAKYCRGRSALQYSWLSGSVRSSRV